ncbi:MAG: hypothetical protein ABI396_18365 [Ktedonobacteraceae bacterium]
MFTKLGNGLLRISQSERIGFEDKFITYCRDRCRSYYPLAQSFAPRLSDLMARYETEVVGR